jgi:hypothetical protein
MGESLKTKLPPVATVIRLRATEGGREDASNSTFKVIKTLEPLVREEAG